MTKLYDTLGVPPDASPEEVKKAFRRRSSKAHPDKGGNHEDQAKVNRAYAVLADPARRAKYDQTGDESAPPSLEQQTLEMVMAAFSEALEHDAPNLLDAARKQFTKGLATLRSSLVTLDRKEAKLQHRRGKVTTKKGQNLLEALLDSKLGQIAQQRAANQEALQMLTAAQELLKDYDSTEPMPSPEELHAAQLNSALAEMRMFIRPRP